MGDSRAAPGFGHVDLDLGEDGDETPARGVPAAVSPSSSASFGQVDFDVAHGEEPAPPSTSRVFGGGAIASRATRRNMAAVHNESTRIVHGDALSNITRPPPAQDDSLFPSAPAGDGATRAWTEVDAQLLAAAGGPLVADAAPSESGVASRDGRVAAMRELYAKGDAAGALALASTIGRSLVPGPLTDHPDASIVIEFAGEQSVDLDDPFGGLIPIDDELAAMRTVVPPKAPAPTVIPPQGSAPPCAAPQLSLTERHSIPTILKSAGDVSKLPIDHRAGFLLAHVDGVQTLEEILDVCAMPASEALELIAKLKEMGVIEFE